MKKISIALPNNSYDVLIGEHIFAKVLSEITKHKLNKNILVIVDSSVFKLHKDYITSCLKTDDGKIAIMKLNLTEITKSLSSVQKIYDTLLKKKFNRDTLVIAIGGGIIGDVAGFAASTFMRGIQLVHIPTTLLAAVDSSIGGKTGVNYFDSKNIIGVFYQPKLVLIDTLFLKSLPQTEWICGLGEIAKYAFLISNQFHNYFIKNFNNLIKRDKKTVQKIIYESVKFKGSVVSEDEKETDLRKILNLGHTFAHAFESEQNYKIKHGEAVVIGIAAALFLSAKMRLLGQDKFNSSISTINKFASLIKIENCNPEKVYRTMFADKKNRANKIRFVLLEDIGKIILNIEAKKSDVMNSIKYGIHLFN